jgi:DNA (cytosine-5)-methyltransferase 1
MPSLRPQVAQVDYPALLAEAWQQHLAPREPGAPTVISTFAGAGGSSLGYSMAGFHELLAVEWDDNAVQTFRLNFPDVPVYHGDIAKLTVEDVLQRTGLQPGELDVFDGSPPCQGFSTAGKRILDDPRNSLFREYVRLLRGLRPKVFVMENVSGMVKGKMKLVFADILRELKASGYLVSARLLNAMYFHVPQSRERMIFIGVRDDLGLQPSHPAAQGKPYTARQAWQGLSETEQAADSEHVWVDEVTRQTKWVSVAANLRPGQKLVPDTPSSIRAYWDRPLPTIQKNAMPGQPPYVRNSTIHPAQPRALSIREMARCQSFPDSFHFTDALNNGMQRIGNSVPPLFMRAIARHIRSELLKA